MRRATVARTRSQKPRIKAESLPLLCDIAEYVERYNVRGENLPSAACDVLDGAVYRDEVEDLVRRKLLTVTHYSTEPILPQELCGTTWTVHLTPRAMNLLFAARLAPASSRRVP